MEPRLENTGTRGRLVDEDGAPLEGLLVTALDERLLLGERVLGTTKSGRDGRFHLAYDPVSRHSLLRSAPNLRVLVYDRRGIRLLAESQVYESERSPVLDLEDVVLPRREAEGWLATGGTGRPLRYTHGNRVRFLVDNHLAFGEALDAVRRARRSLGLTQLYFNPELRAVFPDDASIAAVADGADPSLGDLAAAVLDASGRGVEVRIALNENMVVPDHVDEMAAVLEDAPDVRVRASRRNPGVAHEKLLLLDDDEAFLVGSPFQQRYWDDPRHLPEQPRRGKETKPHHDVSAHVRGPVVTHVSEEFGRIWNGSPTPATADPSDTWSCATPVERRAREGDVSLQFLMTTPVLGGSPAERSILEGFERMLAEAERFVYAENQYFTCARAARAIDRALAAHDGLEVILLLNEKMDIPGYEAVQKQRLDDLLGSYGDQLGVFSAYTHGSRDGRDGVLPIYIHSKTTVADDVCVNVGSANLDGVSLDGAVELGMPDVVNEEANILVLDGVEDAPRTGIVADLRRRLWSEHLATPEDELREEPAEGWLALWRRHAEANKRIVLAGRHDLRSRVLPFGLDIPRDLRL